MRKSGTCASLEAETRTAIALMKTDSNGTWFLHVRAGAACTTRKKSIAFLQCEEVPHAPQRPKAPAARVKCVRRLALLPTHVGVGVVLLMADGKGRDAVSGEMKGMQIKDGRAAEAGAVPWKNASCKVDTSRLGRRGGWGVRPRAHPALAWVVGCRGGRRGCAGRWRLIATLVHFPAWRPGMGCGGEGGEQGRSRAG